MKLLNDATEPGPGPWKTLEGGNRLRTLIVTGDLGGPKRVVFEVESPSSGEAVQLRQESNGEPLNAVNEPGARTVLVPHGVRFRAVLLRPGGDPIDPPVNVELVGR